MMRKFDATQIIDELDKIKNHPVVKSIIELCNKLNEEGDNPDIIVAVRKQLLKILNDGKEAKNTLDAVYNALIILAKLAPVNRDYQDPISLETIKPENMVCIPTVGLAYDINTLVEFHNKRPPSEQKGETKTAKELRDPKLNALHPRDIAYIIKVAAEHQPPLDIKHLKKPTKQPHTHIVFGPSNEDANLRMVNRITDPTSERFTPGFLISILDALPDSYKKQVVEKMLTTSNLMDRLIENNHTLLQITERIQSLPCLKPFAQEFLLTILTDPARFNKLISNQYELNDFKELWDEKSQKTIQNTWDFLQKPTFNHR